MLIYVRERPLVERINARMSEKAQLNFLSTRYRAVFEKAIYVPDNLGVQHDANNFMN